METTAKKAVSALFPEGWNYQLFAPRGDDLLPDPRSDHAGAGKDPLQGEVIMTDVIDLIEQTFHSSARMSFAQSQSREVVDLTADLWPSPTKQPFVGLRGDAATRGSLAAVVDMTARRPMLPPTGTSPSVTVSQYTVPACAPKPVIDLTDERTDGARFTAPVPAPCGNIPCVYVLEHTATFRNYTGQTNALQRRLW